MPKNSAVDAGVFTLGGDLQINRLGFGAMRITGRGIWGEPEDRGAAISTLEALAGLDVNFVDTADSYGPDVSERLIREVLHPYDNVLVATKAGLTRQGPDRWTPKGEPAYLRQQAYSSCERLGVGQIALWQLHRIDSRVPREEQFSAVQALREEGVIRHAGLSEVGIEDIKAAQRYFPVVTVQNRYNLVDRTHEDVLAFCEQEGIGFIPFFPLAAGSLAKPGTALDAIAKAHGATPGQIALAWMLQRSPVMLPIPGTGNPAHLAENVAAAAIHLSGEEFAVLDQLGRSVKS
jgi:pyridoxine 4-dehydrogenase